MEQEKKEITIFFLDSWLNEAITRCDNFLENISKPVSFENTFHKRLMFDEHYVLTATVMSRRYASQLVHHAPKGLKGSIEEFIEKTKDAVDVRDMREHSDEYFLGKGRKQDDFFKGSGNNIQCDMSSSIRDERGYMLGNLIAMEFVHQECTKLLQTLRQHA